MYKKEQGFTLMELMITVVIVGILAAIAYPNYLDHLMRTRRSDAQTSLVNLAAYMEHYFTENSTYLGATPVKVGLPAISPQGYYNLTITNLSSTGYTLNAVPVPGGPQAADTCGTLSITSTNIKSASGSGVNCW